MYPWLQVLTILSTNKPIGFRRFAMAYMDVLMASAPFRAAPSCYLKLPVTTRLANKKFAFACGLDFIQLRYLHLHPL